MHLAAQSEQAVRLTQTIQLCDHDFTLVAGSLELQIGVLICTRYRGDWWWKLR
jgi:hypothetical protein